MKKYFLLLAIFAFFSGSTFAQTMTCPADKTLNTNSDGTANYNNSTVVKAADGLAPIYTDPNNSTVLKYVMTGATTAAGNGAISGLALTKGVTNVTYNQWVGTTTLNTCSFKVTIVDNEPPRFATGAAVTQDACVFTTQISTSPIVSDNVDAASDITVNAVSDITTLVSGCSSKAANIKYIQKRTIIYKATDKSGNTATTSRTINLRDMQAPTLSTKTADVTIASANITVPSSAFVQSCTDNCGGVCAYASCRNDTPSCTNFASSISLTPSLIPAGQNSVTLPVLVRATDVCGNVSYVTASIVLRRQGT
jgi:hypothetical protein